MGADTNYLCIEPAEGVDPDDLESRLLAGETFDAWSERRDDTLIVAGYDHDSDPAMEQLQAVERDVHRAFLLHVADTATTSTGWVYEQTAAGLVEQAAITGGERYGIDVIDYVKREYDLDGPR